MLLYQKVINVVDTSLFADWKILFRLYQPKSILPVLLKFSKQIEILALFLCDYKSKVLSKLIIWDFFDLFTSLACQNVQNRELQSLIEAVIQYFLEVLLQILQLLQTISLEVD